jgi:hypothetical protein
MNELKFYEHQLHLQTQDYIRAVAANLDGARDDPPHPFEMCPCVACCQGVVDNIIDALYLEARAESKRSQSRAQATRGFVYLMRNNRNGFVKIGFSKAPHYREKTLQSEEPEVELIFCIPGSLADEQDLHEVYTICRVRGEWFDLTTEQIGEIRAAFIKREIAMKKGRRAS